MKKILLGLIVMMAMVGTAAADPFYGDLWNAAGTGSAPNPLIIHPGENLTFSFHGDNITAAANNTPLAYSTTVGVISGSGDAADVIITTPDYFTPVTLLNPIPTYGFSYTDVGVIHIELNASAPVDTIYQVSIYAGSTPAYGEGAFTIDAGSSTNNMQVPEFPTIALPVAAILGLAFIFQRRKEED